MRGPGIFGLRLRERRLESEGRMLGGQPLKIVLIEDVLPGPRTEPEADSSLGVQGFKQVRDVRRSGAMPEPPPMYTISFSVCLMWKSPKGPKALTRSPGFKLKT